MGTRSLVITNEGGLATVIGSTAPPLQDNHSVLVLAENFSDSSSPNFAQNISVSLSASAGFPVITGQLLDVRNTSNSGDGEGQCVGRSTTLTINGTQAYGAGGFVGDFMQMVIGDVQSNSITDMYGYFVSSPAFLGNAKPVSSVGVQIADQGNVDVGYTAGLRISSQTGSNEVWGFDVDTKSRISGSLVVGNSDSNSSLFGPNTSSNQNSVVTIGRNFTTGTDSFNFGTQSQISTTSTEAMSPIGGLLLNVENNGIPSTPLSSTTIGAVIQSVAGGGGDYDVGRFATIASIIASDVGQTGALSDSRHFYLLSPTWLGNKPVAHNGIEIRDQGSSGIALSRAIYIANQTGSDKAVGLSSDAVTELNNDLRLTPLNNLVIQTTTQGRIGRGSLSSGTVTINNSSITVNTRVLITPDVSTAGATIGTVGESFDSRVPGVSFTVNSTLITDTNSFTYMLIEEETVAASEFKKLSKKTSENGQSKLMDLIKNAIEKMKSKKGE